MKYKIVDFSIKYSRCDIHLLKSPNSFTPRLSYRMVNHGLGKKLSQIQKNPSFHYIQLYSDKNRSLEKLKKKDISMSFTYTKPEMFLLKEKNILNDLPMEIKKKEINFLEEIDEILGKVKFIAPQKKPISYCFEYKKPTFHYYTEQRYCHVNYDAYYCKETNKSYDFETQNANNTFKKISINLHNCSEFLPEIFELRDFIEVSEFDLDNSIFYILDDKITVCKKGGKINSKKNNIYIKNIKNELSIDYIKNLSFKIN